MVERNNYLLTTRNLHLQKAEQVISSALTGCVLERMWDWCKWFCQIIAVKRKKKPKMGTIMTDQEWKEMWWGGKKMLRDYCPLFVYYILIIKDYSSISSLEVKKHTEHHFSYVTDTIFAILLALRKWKRAILQLNILSKHFFIFTHRLPIKMLL